MSKPPNSSKGFTLLETMTALLILVVCLTTLGSILGRVSTERQSILQNEMALTLLNNHLTTWAAGSSTLPAELNQNNTSYHFDWEPLNPNTIELCVTWKNSGERNQKLCGRAKR